MKSGSMESAPRWRFLVIKKRFKPFVSEDPASDPLAFPSDENPHPSPSLHEESSYEPAGENHHAGAQLESSDFAPLVVDLTETSDEETGDGHFNLAAESDGWFSEFEQQITTLPDVLAEKQTDNHLHSNLTRYALQDLTSEQQQVDFTSDHYPEEVDPKSNVNCSPKNFSQHDIAIDESEDMKLEFEEFDSVIFDVKPQIIECPNNEECDKESPLTLNNSPKNMASEEISVTESKDLLLFTNDYLKTELEESFDVKPEISELINRESVKVESSGTVNNVKGIPLLNNSSDIQFDASKINMKQRSPDFKLKPKLHTRSKKCKKCPKTFSTQVGLKRHYDSIHLGIYLKCHICNKSLATKTLMETHILSAHTKKRPFRCTFCHKQFCTRGILKTHSLIHSGIRPFECDICSKTFASKGILKTHAKTHVETKYEFQCEFCDNKYTTKGILKTHYLNHSSIKSFECKVCGNTFSTSGKLKNHRRRCCNSDEDT